VRTRLKITLALIYSVALLELAARVAFALSDRGVVSLWAETDEMWQRSWFDRHHGKPEIYYQVHEFDDTKGWRTKSHLREVRAWGLPGVRPMDDAVLSTNALGFRGTVDPQLPKNPQRTRILVLGDSFTFGDEVSDDETYPYYLQRALPDAEVINAGASGYAHDQMLILLREKLDLAPDVVVLGFLQMDMNRNRLGFRDFAKPRFEIVDDRIEVRGYPLPTPVEVLGRLRFRPYLVDLESSIRYRLRDRLGTEQREVERVTLRILAEIAHVSSTIGATFVLAYLPDGREIAADPAATSGERFFSRACAAIVSARCVNTRSEFALRRSQGTEFKVSGHWGPEGHQAVAHSLAAFLSARTRRPSETDGSPSATAQPASRP
jgi:hypothetical protein